jgi:signal transduction histidine kinase
MKPASQQRVKSSVELAVDLGRFEFVRPTAADAAPREERIPGPVSLALRRATSHVDAKPELGPACDVSRAQAVETLGSICAAVRRAYVSGRPGAVRGGPLAAQTFDRLHGAFIEELDRLRGALKPGELSAALRAFELVRKEAESDESQRFLAALKSDDAVDLVVDIAHDMRSPLTAILMLTEIVRRTQPQTGDAIQSRQMALVYSAAFGLNALVNDVIALARDGDRLIDPDGVPFSVSGLMKSVVDMIRPIAEERELALAVNIPPARWRVGQPIALSRVLLNLASNALKYTETGEVVMSAVELCPTQLRFEVTDTGPGIPPDVLPTLFEPLVKRSPTARGHRFSSTGLGLAICRKLLRDMGSELHLDTARDKGTRFFFELTLPLVADCHVQGDESFAAIL